ncbi:MAG: hypothetical protein CL816_08415 [Coxiellaceae bacterium]|nr:hypothetical protein [Coxiellaceae bacterium]
MTIFNRHYVIAATTGVVWFALQSITHAGPMILGSSTCTNNSGSGPCLVFQVMNTTTDESTKNLYIALAQNGTNCAGPTSTYPSWDVAIAGQSASGSWDVPDSADCTESTGILELYKKQADADPACSLEITSDIAKAMQQDSGKLKGTYTVTTGDDGSCIIGPFTPS